MTGGRPRCRLSAAGLIASVALAGAGGTLAGAQPVPGNHHVIRVDEGLVSARVAGAFLDEVLIEIGAQARVRIVLDEPRNERISLDLESVPLGEVLRRLVKGNFLLVYGADGQPLTMRVLGPRIPSSGFVARGGSGRGGESADALLRDLQAEDADRRGEAMIAIGELKDERVLDPLIEAVQTDADPDVRRQGVRALEEFGGLRALEALAVLADRDADAGVRQHAVEAVATLAGDGAVGLLARSVSHDPEPFVRYEALVGLARIAGADAASSIQKALHDPDELIRAKARELLETSASVGR